MSNDEINRVIEDYVNQSIERDHKKAHKRHKKRIKEWTKEYVIESATELSETGILTLESVKAAIKKLEDEHEEFMKSVKGISSAVPAYIAIWAVSTFLLALAINLPIWGALTSPLGKSYWETLFSDGLWTFLVGGIGAAVILILYEEGVIP